MALVKYGAGVVQMSGSIAGDVHARNRFGNYIRPRTKPVNPKSERQEAIRTVLSTLAERWEAILTPVQRGAWGTYAAAVAMKNRLGESIYLTGFNHYLRSNSNRLYIGAAVIDEGPTVLSLPEKDPVLAISATSIAGQTITMVCSALIWGANGDQLNGIALYLGVPQLKTRNFFGGPWRYMGIIDPGEGAIGQATEDAPFAFALDQKIWVMARVLTMAGRLSEAWTVEPLVVEADP